MKMRLYARWASVARVFARLLQMALEIHALMQDSQDHHVALPPAPEENHMPPAGTGQQTGSHVAAIHTHLRRPRQRRETVIQPGQIPSRLIRSPTAQRVGADAIQIGQRQRGKPKRGQTCPRSFSSTCCSE